MKALGVTFDRRADDGLEALSLIVSSGGPWWPYRGFVVLTERPVHIRRDDRNRLHCTDGPAVLYPDGWGFGVIHGVRVPAQVILAPETLTADQILKERNAEVRRVMIERHGHERFLRSAKAAVVDSDKDALGFPRRLLRIDIPGDEALVAVEVTNSTPEPDGHHKTYMPRVDPRHVTCADAIASTWRYPDGSRVFEDGRAYKLAAES